MLPVPITSRLRAYSVNREILHQVPIELGFGARVRCSKPGSNIGQVRNRRRSLSMLGLPEEGLFIYRLLGHGPEADGLMLERVLPSQSVDPELLLRMQHWLDVSR